MARVYLLFFMVAGIYVGDVFGQYDNQYTGILNKVCPVGQAMTSVTSIFSNFYRDRRFRFQCSPINGDWNTCDMWQGPLNNLGGTLNHYCDFGKVLRGVFSFYSNGDRRWYMLCCSDPDYRLTRCRSSYPATPLAQPFVFQRPPNYIFGIVGFFNSWRSDRRFHFGYCPVESVRSGNFQISQAMAVGNDQEAGQIGPSIPRPGPEGFSYY